MSFGRLGWVPVAAACVLFFVGGALALSGAVVRVDAACWQVGSCGRFAGGELGVPHLAVPLAITFLGVGYAVFAVSGTPPFASGAARIGLGTLATGLLAFEVANNMPIGPETNPAESLPLVVAYGVGMLAIPVGYGVTVVSLLGPSRWAALLLPIGLSAVLAPWLPPLVVLGVVAYRAHVNSRGAGPAP